MNGGFRKSDIMVLGPHSLSSWTSVTSFGFGPFLARSPKFFGLWARRARRPSEAACRAEGAAPGLARGLRVAELDKGRRRGLGRGSRWGFATSHTVDGRNPASPEKP